MEQQTLIILAIIFVSIIIALGPDECNCTSEGASSAPAMSAYLKAVGGNRGVTERRRKSGVKSA
jgi:hypothetical protein